MTPKTLLMTLAAAGVATSLFYKARASRPAAVMPWLTDESGAMGDATTSVGSESPHGAERLQAEQASASPGSPRHPTSWPFPAVAEESANDGAADGEPIKPGLPDVSRGA